MEFLPLGVTANPTSLLGFFPLGVLILLLRFSPLKSQSLRISLIGFFPLGDAKVTASLQAPSRLAYGQWKSSAAGISPTRSPYFAAEIFFTQKPNACTSHWWTVADSPACNPNRPAPMITTVTTNLARADRAVIAVPQFHLQASIHFMYIWSIFS